MDENGYPDEDTLEYIQEYNLFGEPNHLFRFIYENWYYPTFVDIQEGSEETIYEFSTGGWSGNEELISALQKNPVMWSLYWDSSHRGGTFKFRVPRNPA